MPREITVGQTRVALGFSDDVGSDERALLIERLAALPSGEGGRSVTASEVAAAAIEPAERLGLRAQALTLSADRVDVSFGRKRARP